MRTIGIDLSSQPEDTAVCEIHWDTGTARIVTLRSGWKNCELLEVLRRDVPIAIDVPLGWPIGFVENLKRWAEFGTWNAGREREQRLRATDRWLAGPSKAEMKEKLIAKSDDYAPVRICPLSVSSDRIAVPAMRAALLLSRAGLHQALRNGSARLMEVYPAAALKVWGMPHRKYKGRDEGATRTKIVNAIVTKLGRTSFVLTDTDQATLVQNDHCLDAWVAALVARARLLDRTVPIPKEHEDNARREGWIMLPQADSLLALLSGTRAD